MKDRGSDELTDLQAEVLAGALDGKIPVRANCHNVQDIRNAISLAEAFDLNLVIEGATEAYRAVSQIQASQVPVVLTGTVLPGRRDGRDYTRDLALGRINPAGSAVLAQAGIPLALSAPTNGTISDLRFVAGHAVTQGLSTDQSRGEGGCQRESGI